MADFIAQKIEATLPAGVGGVAFAVLGERVMSDAKAEGNKVWMFPGKRWTVKCVAPTP